MTDEYEDVVRPAWIDHNGHMNLAYYVLVFAGALDGLRARLGLGGLRLSEMHTVYAREVNLGDRLVVTTHVLDVRDARLHLFQEMRHAAAGYRAATFESVAEHALPFDGAARVRLAALVAPAPPEGAGRRIAMPA